MADTTRDIRAQKARRISYPSSRSPSPCFLPRLRISRPKRESFSAYFRWRDRLTVYRTLDPCSERLDSAEAQGEGPGIPHTGAVMGDGGIPVATPVGVGQGSRAGLLAVVTISYAAGIPPHTFYFRLSTTFHSQEMPRPYFSRLKDSGVRRTWVPEWLSYATISPPPYTTWR